MDFFDMVSEDDFLKAVREDSKVQQGLDKLAGEVKSYWQDVAPKDTGEYAASVKVRRVKRDSDGNPIRRVSTTHPAAHIIEYGSVDTPKFGVRAKVENHFKEGQ